MLVWIIHNTALAALLAGGIALLARFRRCSPALLHALWLLVLVRLLMPPGLVSWPCQLPESWWTSTTTTADAVSTQAPVKAMPSKEELILVRIADGVAIDSKVLSPAAGDSSPEIHRDKNAELSTYRWIGRTALAAWLIGAAVVLIRFVCGHWKLRQLLKLADSPSSALQRRVQVLAEKMDLSTPRIQIVGGLPSPLVFGLLRPVLLWPSGLESRLSEAGVQSVLVHELAHLRRRDHWVRWLEVLAGCIWWWNPLFRLVRSRIRQYAEHACDAWVLALLPQARRAYAEALVEVCSRVAQTQPVLALGIEGVGKKDFQRRLTMIMREKVACRLPRRVLLALVVLALVALPGFTLGEHSVSPRVFASERSRDEVLIAELDALDLLMVSTPVAEHDHKLAQIEEQILALLQEIRALKQQAAPQVEQRRELFRLHDRLIQREKEAVEALKKTAETARLKAQDEAKAQLGLQMDRGAWASRAARSVDRADIVVLSRTTYELTPSKADALAKLINDHIKTRHLDAKTEGDKLIVTTSQEVQRVVGELVNLMKDGSISGKNRDQSDSDKQDE